ncbi:MAG TPA: methylated-DNA--[protein]-cysteine S-methyltransferase [Phycicoccus sp.]|jgi:AraC family transcriptional regulator of adaptative response/methylated-DNA-[protein]-cysteine methyltransferase|nr:methylated-DNA--[protein]-cysteine S-methyltransferase [Phycicoccus sp.]
MTATTTTLPARRTMMRAVTTRDPEWDGLFIVAVRTTGIACRPVCPSRPALPENREFFATLADAEAAGYRPCRRCHPGRPAPPPAWWGRLEAAVAAAHTDRLSDQALADLGLDPVVIRRHFRRTHGMTFHAWARAQRVAKARHRLRGGAMLDEVILTSGYNSHSGFRDAFARVFGVPPGRARSGEAIVANTFDSPVGPLVAATTDEGIILLEFGDLARLEEQAARLRRRFTGPFVVGEHPLLQRLEAELAEYFAGQRRDFTLPLLVRGTPFEERVWAALRAIPYGTTCSYADIARVIGSPNATRAVGSANGRNRLAIVIPCHRVVNADGKLGGYGGGLWRKKRLLELES